MPDDAEFCTECGAPLTDAPGVAGSDAEVYRDLARANLMRMRGEFKTAQEICLAILRRYPNNHTANMLLGDIAAEEGDLDQAAEWFELALDIVPDHAETKKKLAAIREELARRQAKTTVAELGIPKRSGPIALYVGLAGIVAVFAIAAAINANRKPQATYNDPIVLKDEPKPAPAEPVEEVQPTKVVYRVDEELASSLVAKLAADHPLEGRLLTASVAEPGNAVRLSLPAAGEDGEWELRAKLVMGAFEAMQAAPKVEIQYWTQGRSTPDTQIVERTTYEKTQAPDFDASDMALLVETLFGHQLEPPADDSGQPPTNQTGTPPMGEGADKPADDAAPPAGTGG